MIVTFNSIVRSLDLYFILDCIVRYTDRVNKIMLSFSYRTLRRSKLFKLFHL
jgi:hypothetical protein